MRDLRDTDLSKIQPMDQVLAESLTPQQLENLSVTGMLSYILAIDPDNEILDALRKEQKEKKSQDITPKQGGRDNKPDRDPDPDAGDGRGARTGSAAIPIKIEE